MNTFERSDFDTLLANIIYDSRVDSPDCGLDDDTFDYDDDDGQPTHYEEMQDVYGGDDYFEQWEDDYGDY